MSAYTYAYGNTHALTFLSDSMRNALREVIRENGLDPDKLMGEWEWVERGIKAWVSSQDLEGIVIEFFPPYATTASARWDFPITYSGSGVEDEMWLDKNYLRQIISKAKRPSKTDSYRILLLTKPGRPDVPGISSCEFLATNGMTAFSAGTVIATGHLTASATYWR
jgi:hypothetical protein